MRAKQNPSRSPKQTDDSRRPTRAARDAALSTGAKAAPLTDLAERRHVEFRAYRNSKLYRSLTRILRVYNRRLFDELRARGFSEYSPAFPTLLANLDTEGTRIGVLAERAGVTRQAAGQMLTEIEAAGYVATHRDPSDGRATIATFTPKGLRFLKNVIEVVEDFEGSLDQYVPEAQLDAVRFALAVIADGVDPSGALGRGDRAAGPSPRRRT